MENIAAFESIENSLKSIAESLNQRSQAKPKLGFVFSNSVEIIYANIVAGNGDGWYRLDDGATETLPPTFWGYVTDIKFPRKERRGKEVCKFNLHMKANDRTYIFESGWEAFFCRSILTALSSCPVETLRRPVKLYSYIADLNSGDRTLSAAVYTHEGVKLNAAWKSDNDWSEIAKLAMSNVALANQDH